MGFRAYILCSIVILHSWFNHLIGFFTKCAVKLILVCCLRVPSGLQMFRNSWKVFSNITGKSESFFAKCIMPVTCWRLLISSIFSWNWMMGKFFNRKPQSDGKNQPVSKIFPQNPLIFTTVICIQGWPACGGWLEVQRTAGFWLKDSTRCRENGDVEVLMWDFSMGMEDLWMDC